MGISMTELAAVGAPVGPLFDTVIQLIEKSVAFSPTLKSVKLTVEALRKVMLKIEASNTKLGGGDRAGEVEELKKELEGVMKLIEKLGKVKYWNLMKAYYTSQLVALDESLKRHLEILLAQGVSDGKETLVLANQTTRLAKDIMVKAEENTNHLVGLDGTLTAGLLDMQKRQDELANMIRKLKENGRENRVWWLIEAAELGATLDELRRAVRREVHPWRYPFFKRLDVKVTLIDEVVERKRSENKEKWSFLAEEIKDYTVKINKGVEDIRSMDNIVDWTEELKAEYTTKFLDLETTLDSLYKRLSELNAIKWKTGKCGGSCGRETTSTMNDLGYQ